MKSYKINPLYLVVIAACYICHTEAVTKCDRGYGPAGNVHCKKFLNYYGYQWATCRTDTYIRNKSNGKHQCNDRSRIYCYYQCMHDVHDKESGAVFPDCKCSPGDPAPTESVPLPAWCHSPDGSSCSWYRECLTKAHPQCENDKDEYAIKFAEKFCKLYDESYSKFSPYGQQWVNAVRKCLQVKLVPLVDKTRVKTCAELKSTAFESHTPCYLNPDASSLSYCDLSYWDRAKVFWTIKSALVDAFSSSLQGVLEVMTGCTRAAVQSYAEKISAKIEKAVEAISGVIIDSFEKAVDHILKETETRIKTWLKETLFNPQFPIQLDLSIELDDLFKLFNRRKRSVPDDRGIARSQLAGRIVDAVAAELKWQDNGVAWFAYANNKTVHDNNTMSIRLLVEDRFKYGAFDNTSLSSPKPANLTTTLVQLSEAVLKGTLGLKIDGESITIRKLDGCLDWNCTIHAFNITLLERQESNGAVMYGAMSLLTYFGLLMINSLFNIS